MASEECTEFDELADRASGQRGPSRVSLRRLAASITFLAGLGLMLGVLNFVLVPSNATEWWWKDYRALTPNSLDVVNVGNSHLQCSVAPMQLWRDYGIASWNLTSGGINAATKLAYVREALKTQTPDVLTLEVHALDYTAVSTVPRNHDAYSFMPWGLPKFEAITRTAAPAEWERLVFRLMAHHQRYSILTITDFDPRADLTRVSDGGANALSTSPNPGGEVSAWNAIPWQINEELAQENLVFIRGIAGECEQRDIQLVLWAAPVSGDGYTGKSDPLVWVESKLGTDYPDVAYINSNYNHDEIGLIQQDFRDRGHLYAWGMEKTTRWFAESVLERYFRPSGAVNLSAQWWDTESKKWDPPTYDEAVQEW